MMPDSQKFSIKILNLRFLSQKMTRIQFAFVNERTIDSDLGWKTRVKLGIQSADQCLTNPDKIDAKFR